MDIENLLRKLVAIPSISGHEQELGLWLINYLEKMGFKVTKQPLSHDKSRFNVLAEKGQGDKCLLLYGHMDTVEVAKDWTSDPFKLLKEGDHLIGLGANDMKGGVAAILKAIEDFDPVDYKLKICFAADEELFSAGAFELAKSGWLKGIDFCIVPEIGDDSPKKLTDNNPTRLVLGRRGRVSIQVDVYGRSSHGAVPSEGINAVEIACEIAPILKKELLDSIEIDREKNWSGDVFISSFTGGSEFLSVPEKASFVFNRHFLPSKTVDECVSDVKTILKKLKLPSGAKTTVTTLERPTPYLEAFETPVEDSNVQKLLSLIEGRFGKSSISYGLSVADENLLGQSVPTVVYGPVGSKSHQAGEWVSLNSLQELSAVYKTFLRFFS